MQKAFHCPHCDKKYPVLPTLVGRKVRCTACKNVFQLQYDGVALKVDVGAGSTVHTQQSANAALESKHTGATEAQSSSTQNLSGMRQAVGAGRQQTKAIRRKTERIKRIRSSLQGAAEEALSNVQEDASPAATTAAATTRKKSVEIVLSGSRPQTAVRLWPLFLVAALSALVLFWFLNLEPAPEIRALQDYAAPLSVAEAQYPGRMDRYRSRMWIYSRDGQSLPPVLLNVDEASIHFVTHIDWLMLSSVCVALLDGMQLNRKFGIWHKPLPPGLGTEAQSLEQLWQAHLLKGSVAGFYKELLALKIPHLHAMELPRLLAEKGLTKEEVYIASLFLAGTADAFGQACTGLGLDNAAVPTRMQVFEFNGPASHVLIDAHGHYSYARGDAFCGLVLGCEGLGSEDGLDQSQQWRVFDLRLGESMSVFYTQKHNPLIQLAAIAHEQLGNELAQAVQAAK